ncbi:DNA-binding MarR family transcriptional regulator [Halopolyspora algeriensis]|uniref:DNA-binding MarR family transcriptional regulator n=1 Tax=Halopolyspora algeriensis TaxID=1500506 RepID=A0A368VUG6_9ACTN|nr:MarR family transcriptional regulator [Halopolyspora algeriensis]RCW43616.1 DNA-binding MarR family transcriptional regulator [Halopolyspora algeriensis]TQM47599.1 DNA-binding MarR family transcriptional regulator [Halopolyspora algeriensis]
MSETDRTGNAAVDTVEAQRTLAGRLRVAVVRLNRRLRAQAESGVTLSQLSTLASLRRNGALTPGELAAKEGVQPPSMTRVIASLEDLGLVARRKHPTDGRQVIVELTDAGNARIEAEVSARERWLDLRLADLTEDERATLSRAVEILDRMAGR